MKKIKYLYQKRVLKSAWNLLADNFGTWSECLKEGHRRVKSINSIEVGTTFHYRKKDGTIRIATVGIVPSNYTFKSTTTKINPFIERYFDLEKNAFRSFKVENFIGVVQEINLITLKAA